MANKHLALLVSFSVENGFKPALLVAAKRYMQLVKKILLIYFILTCSLIFGQETKLRNNSAYLELLGNGGSWASVNYERIINYDNAKYIHNAIRVGFSWSTNRWDKSPIYSLPIELNTLIGKNGHFIELSVGITPFFGTSSLNDSIIPYEHKSNYNDTYFIRLGYRYMRKGVVFRLAPLLGYVQINNLTKKRNAVLGFGISVGGTFNFGKTSDIDDAYFD